jgi:alkylation response protein AidB-like acyl-CoA dehydrogenase
MGITAFIVERETPGPRSAASPQDGVRTSPMAEVIFEDCRVPVAQRLGREGRGVEVFECSMEWESRIDPRELPGRHEAPDRECVRHARERTQFGKPIGKNQSVANASST